MFEEPASPREESPASNPITLSGNSENGSEYPDSGVVLISHVAGTAPGAAPMPNGHTLLNSRHKLSVKPTPVTELRRPSIVEMMPTGMVINKRGSCEINLENVLAEDVEMMYAYHGAGGEDGGESSGQQLNSEGGSSQHLSSGSDVGMRFSPAHSWWNPTFNSPILERHWRKKVIQFLRRRFRVAVMFLGLFALLWIVFFSVHLPFEPPESETEAESSNNDLAAYSVRYSWWYVVGGAVVFVIVGCLLILTFSRFYSRLAFLFSIFLALVLMTCSCALALAVHFDQGVQGFSTISFVAQFAITGVVILVMFTLSRLPLWLSLLLSITYVVVLEVLVGVFTYGLHVDSYPEYVFVHSTIARIIFEICLILSGVATAYLSQVRLHATFWKIAQCVLSQKALDLERELEEKTILSMMPRPFAEELMSLQVQLAFMVKQKVGLDQEGIATALQSPSAPFAFSSMDRVTILFADIVDFTEFSSNLSAAELVGILNEVFSTFDDLVTKYKCEKISTLGDCYFCVSGCPETITNHADNCVDMGLAIIGALEEFRKRTGLPIEMRIGVHTGSVFCGVMGTRRFKFDVWSKDVTVAKCIESVSTPGRVLISSTTKNFLSSGFVVEEANMRQCPPALADLPLYYVIGRRNRALSMGTSVMEWRRKIQVIDTIHKPDTLTRSTSDSAECNPFLCLPWRRKMAAIPVMKISNSHSTSSIVDIFSKQTQLQRYTSYTDLPTTQDQQQAVMDRKIVDLMEEQKVDFDTYFDPQLKIISLQFHDPDWEAAYKNYGRDLYDGSDGDMTETELGFRITKLSYMIDTVTLFLIFLLIMVGSGVCLSSTDTFVSNILPSLAGLFAFGFLVEIIILLFVTAVYVPARFPKWFSRKAQLAVNWYVRSLIALFLIYYPMTVVYVSIAQCQGPAGIESVEGLAHVQMSFFVTIVVLISSINFMEVSHITKLVGGALSASLTIFMVVVVHLDLCIQKLPDENDTTTMGTGPTQATTDRFQTESPESYLTTYYTRHITPEAVILLLLILILLAIVNRMSEISVRLSFIGRVEAAVRRRYTRQRKTQAEWLLFNIIPPHVALELRKTGKYSQNHDCVGVIFATVVNFEDFYLQMGDSGVGSLCVLNKIVSKFDMLLDRTVFRHVEKIKTIGSTYMAASGLDLPRAGPCQVEHLVELLEFVWQLFEALEAMNNQEQTFTFQMRIGFNFGSVTSGVVGSRKMLYDIWGDTVNVASRMDSTGHVGKVHMPEVCLRLLKPYVKCEFDQIVNVKGKGEMRTVVVTRDQFFQPCL